MISLKEIEKTIAELESGETSFSNCEKLANLYVVYDHLNRNKTFTAEPEEKNTEFFKAVKGKNIHDVYVVIDELMETMSVVNNRAYQSVVQKLRNL
jgi:hypothetical protein